MRQKSTIRDGGPGRFAAGQPEREATMEYDRCKIVGKDGVELVQLSMEENRITIRTAPSSSFMTQPVGGSEPPIVMPREHAEALAFILRNSSITEFQEAKVIRAD